MTPMSDPVPVSEAVRDRFRRQRTRDTGAEMAVRRAVHARGLRYRVDVAPEPALRRRADLVFRPAKVAVFVDGCYWHGCRQCGWMPKSNAGWWADKIQRNRARDADTNARLLAAGWLVIRAWEHEEPERVADQIVVAVSKRRSLQRTGGRATAQR